MVRKKLQRKKPIPWISSPSHPSILKISREKFATLKTS
jgi:hypothetical protein